ncbi:MAG TPA: phosphatidate cytidylyltransferase [Anaerolineales bacterium]|nr:phosphatidate cytidylyltransferase [Anaerolineales bacterium]
MLSQRVLVAAVILPVGLVVIYLGGPVYTLMIGLMLALAAWEYDNLMRVGGYHPAGVLVIAGVLAFVIGRALNGFASGPLILTVLIMAVMVYHLVGFERGQPQAAPDFGVSLGGALYLGWIGAYFISLRQLPDGLWWMLLALPITWAVDSGAYLIGRRWGRRKLSPRLSPKKTWEGYWGGVAAGVLGGLGLTLLWQAINANRLPVTLWQGALLGLILAAVTPLGDLGESMFKRQVGQKDSSHLLPGHGGVFDRIDSWLWSVVISYYFVYWLIL